MVVRLTASLVFRMVLSLAAGEVVDVFSVREVLEDDLKYADGLIEDNGVAYSFDPEGSLGAQALAGSMVALIHMGLGDPESLELLRRVDDAVNRRVESENGLDLGFDGGVLADVDNLLTHTTVAKFFSEYYGLTGDLRSRSSMLKIVQSLEGKVGWSPQVSKSSLLVSSSRISFMAGGGPFTTDVAEALNEV